VRRALSNLLKPSFLLLPLLLRLLRPAKHEKHEINCESKKKSFSSSGRFGQRFESKIFFFSLFGLDRSDSPADGADLAASRRRASTHSLASGGAFNPGSRRNSSINLATSSRGGGGAAAAAAVNRGTVLRPSAVSAGRQRVSHPRDNQVFVKKTILFKLLLTFLPITKIRIISLSKSMKTFKHFSFLTYLLTVAHSTTWSPSSFSQQP